MKAWLRAHRYAMASAWHQIRKPRGGFLINTLVVAIVLALPFGGFTLLENLRPLTGKLNVEPELSIFLNPSLPRDKATALVKPIRQVLQAAGIGGNVEFVPREKALASFNDHSGLAAAVATLGNNPLPDAYLIRLASFQSAGDAGKLETASAQLRALAGVDHVQVDSAWVKRLAAGMRVSQLALLFLALVLGVVAIAVVFNTVRLQVLGQREEIEVCKLLGATDSFVCRPFYYAGTLLGLLAGLLALGMITLALHPMNLEIAELAQLYGSGFSLVPPGPWQSLSLLAMSAALGLAGALISVRRTLGQLGAAAG